MEPYLLLFIFSPIVMGILIYAIDRVAFSRGLFLLQAALSLAYAALSWQVYPVLYENRALHFVAGGWSPQAGIAFRVDRVSMLFIFMTVLAFWYAYLYTWWSRQKDHKFLFFLSLLQGALFALFLVNDLFSMFVLIELITVTCSILITYKKDGLSIKAGLYYLLYNSIAMLLLFLGIIFIYMQAGTLNISLIYAAGPDIAADPGYRWGIVLVFAAFCLKSALFPVFGWLPLAHASAPASVSALLSGLVVKSGLFIMLRLGALVFIPGVREVLLILGLISGIFGSAMAFCQTDIKRLLSYSTISQVGLITVGLSASGSQDQLGALLHIFNHFLFKSLLFLCAGVIISITGERSISRIRGLYRQSPALAVSVIIGILGITGAPFFNGSISKALITAGVGGGVAESLLFIINAGTILSFVKLGTVLTGAKRCTQCPTDARIISVFLMAVMVLLSYPSELLLLSMLPEPLYSLNLTDMAKETAKYMLLMAGSVLFYRRVYLPHGHYFTKFEGLTYSFHRGVGILTLLLAVLSLLLV